MPIPKNGVRLDVALLGECAGQGQWAGLAGGGGVSGRSNGAGEALRQLVTLNGNEQCLGRFLHVGTLVGRCTLYI